MKTGREQLQNIKNNKKIGLGKKNNIAMVAISWCLTLHTAAFLSVFLFYLEVWCLSNNPMHLISLFC